MIPFHQVCPEPGLSETRSLIFPGPVGDLPAGEYGFLEYYCEDPGCDCRTMLMQVFSRAEPEDPLATISFGWESAQFYTDRLQGDVETGRDIANAWLDPINTQSKHAATLLKIFRDMLASDPNYVARLESHCGLFKRTLRERGPATSSHGQKHSSPARRLHDGQETHEPGKTTMTIPEILQQLRHVPDKADFAPYEAALRAAVDQREAIVPELIASIERVIADPKHYLKHHEECLHLFAIHLLAQFREPLALDSLLRFFSIPGEDTFDLTADIVTENGASILASVCGGDPAPLLRLAHDESVNGFVRGAAIEGLFVQSGWGERPREAVIEDIRRLFHTLPRPGDAYLWASLAGTVCDFNAPELLPECRQIFADNLVDECVIILQDVEDMFACTGLYSSQTGEERFNEIMTRNAPIDAIAECSSWLCFRDKEQGAFPSDAPLVYPAAPPRPTPAAYIPPQPYVAPTKVGRNDPCPCGSGKKYKKCCGGN